MQVLAFDMGQTNSAWALIEDGKLIKADSIKNPIHSFASGFNTSRTLFRKEIEKALSLLTHKECFVVAERFQCRRFNPGAQIETVSAMIGVIATLSKYPMYPVQASHWKSALLKKYGENTMEAFFRDEYSEHICDAIGIGCWFYENETGKDSPYLKQWIPFKKYCRRCWHFYHGCKGTETKTLKSGAERFTGICEKYACVDKSAKCNKCKMLKSCTKGITSKAKAFRITKLTFGCTRFK